MLVLTRKPNQQLHIGNDIVITVVKVRGNTIRLGIEAPKDVRIIRSELEAKAPTATAQPESIVAEIALTTKCEAVADASDASVNDSSAQSPIAPSGSTVQSTEGQSTEGQSTGASSVGRSPSAKTSGVKRAPLKPFTNRKQSQEPRANRYGEDGPMCHSPGQAERPAQAKDKLVRGPLSQCDSLSERPLLGKGRLHNFAVVSRS